MKMVARLKEKSILVVGAGQTSVVDDDASAEDGSAPVGNGRAIAVLAAREGAAVICADINLVSAQETVDIVSSEPGQAAALVVDLADPDQCVELAHQATAVYGPLDGFVFNAGIGIGNGLSGTTLEEWDHTLDVNLRSAFLISRTIVPLMAEGAGIVFASSIAARFAGSNVPAYDTSKGGLEALARHVALEAAPRIRCNSVAYGLIDTPMHRARARARAEQPDATVRADYRFPLARMGTAWEVAAPVVFLLSEESSYITGTNLVVDGGLSSVYTPT